MAWKWLNDRIGYVALTHDTRGWIIDENICEYVNGLEKVIHDYFRDNKIHAAERFWYNYIKLREKYIDKSVYGVKE